MKFVIVFTVFAICYVNAELTPELKAKLAAVGAECTKQSGISDEIVKQSREGKFTEDPKLKDYCFCVSKKIGLQNDDGDIQRDVLKMKVNSILGDEALTETLVTQCAVKRASGLETAYEIIKCLKENSPQHASLV